MRLLTRLKRVWAEERGYTLIELLMVTVILGTVVAALTILFVRASNAEMDMNRRFQAQQAARVAVDRMRREIHCASQITPPGPASSIAVTLPAQCPTAGGVQTTVTYDVVGSNGRFQLRRNSVQLADFVSEQNAFDYTAPVPASSLGKLRMTLPINTTPADRGKEWRLVADIVLRNTTR
jgi:prepilin-type N-terminal cleavage/methylation domain-containing protein